MCVRVVCVSVCNGCIVYTCVCVRVWVSDLAMELYKISISLYATYSCLDLYDLVNDDVFKILCAKPPILITWQYGAIG